MIYAIGDVHGCKEKLEELLNKIKPVPEDTLVFLGDYIDRGPDSKGVINLLIELSQKNRTIFLRGNHEWMFLEFYYKRDDESWTRWEYNGARKTLESYGGIDNIPSEHLKFIENTKIYHTEGKYLFVHAGVKPAVPLEKQNEMDMMWIRREFINYPNPLKGYTVVFGHTPQEEPLIQSDKIGIDTGCVYGRKLTCIRVEDRKIIQVRCAN